MGIKNITTQRGSTTKYSEDVHDGIIRIIKWAQQEIPKDKKKGAAWVQGDGQTYPSHEQFSICDESILTYYGVGNTKDEFLNLLERLYNDYFDIESNKSDGASETDFLLLKDGDSSNSKVILGIKFIRRDEFISMEKYNDKDKKINFTAGSDSSDSSDSSPLNYSGAQTLLIPTLAYFQTKTRKSEMVYGIIMPGIEPTSVIQKFDLKGSLSGRITKQQEIKEKGPSVTLKDQNLFSDDSTGKPPSIVPPGAYEWKQKSWLNLIKDPTPLPPNTIKKFNVIFEGLDKESGENIDCLQQSGIPYNSYAWRFINFITYYVIGPLILPEDKMKKTGINWKHVFSHYTVSDPEQIKNLWIRLIRDVSLLMANKVMDYSILLYVTDEVQDNKLFKIDITDPSGKPFFIYLAITDYYSYGPCPNHEDCGSTPTAQMDNSYDYDKSGAFKAQMIKKNLWMCSKKQTSNQRLNVAAAAAAAAGGKRKKRKKTQKRKKKTQKRKNRRSRRTRRK